MHDGRQRANRPLGVRIKGSRTSDPQEVFITRVLIDSRNFEGQGSRPLHPALLRLPGVSHAFHANKRTLELFRETTLHHHLIATNLHDIEHRHIADRTDFDAVPTGRASPDGTFADGVVEQRGAVSGRGCQIDHVFADVVALVHFQRCWRKLLAGSVCRAHFLATIAHYTSIGVEEVLLWQVDQGVRSKLLDGLVFEIQLEHLPEVGAIRTGHKVERTHEQVGMLRVGEVGKEKQNAAECQPPEEMAAEFKCFRSETANEVCRDEGGRRLPNVRPLLRHQERSAQQARTGVQQDEQADDQRIERDAITRLVEQLDILPDLQRLILGRKAPEQQVADANEGEDRE